jgi:L-alanine-DL-glutamate epimerase-like enolase superfamily enzyme
LASPTTRRACDVAFIKRSVKLLKIVDLRCILFGGHPLLRVVTDAGIDGYSQIESNKAFIVPMVDHFRDLVIGEDPTNVESVMLRIRRRGGSKPWGSIVSAIEMAVWDIAGKAAGVPVHKLLGGKVRDRVRVYNGGVRVPLNGFEPQDYADVMRGMKAAAEGFTIIKYHLAFHGPMSEELPDFFYANPRGGPGHLSRGAITERGLLHVIACVAAMKEVLGDEIGLALDLGPGWALQDAIRLARAVEPFNLMWLEDMLTGDSTPYADANTYRILSDSTTSPIHTGEQLYLRNNFVELISRNAVRVIGPDPCDVGGIAELKWVAEYADLHGILVAPHGIYDGVLGLAAHIQLAAALPDNFIAFEYPVGTPSWWYDIVEGLPKVIVEDGLIDVIERPGMGVDLIPKLAAEHLTESDAGFFD